MRKGTVLRVLLGAMGWAALAAGANAATINSASWSFYQYGYVETESGEFDVAQDDYSAPMGVDSVAGAMLPGATQQSSARMDLLETASGKHGYLLNALFSFDAQASIDEHLGGSMAQAGGGLELFAIDFTLTKRSRFSLDTSVDDAQLFGDLMPGSRILDPGTYSFLFLNPFAIDAEATATRALPTDVQSGEHFFDFSFVTVPSPGALGLILAGMGLVSWTRVRARRAEGAA